MLTDKAPCPKIFEMPNGDTNYLRQKYSEAKETERVRRLSTKMVGTDVEPHPSHYTFSRRQRGAAASSASGERLLLAGAVALAVGVAFGSAMAWGALR